MKKKIIAVVVAILIVTMVCSLAGCSSSMFDGSYRKEATDEQAKSAWDGARVAFGAQASTVATMASSNSNEIVKGWTGIKFSVSQDITTTGTINDVKTESILKSKAEGAFLFDASATSVTGSTSAKITKGKDKTELNYSVGVYDKDDVLYNSIVLGDSKLNVKFEPNMSVIFNPIKSAFSQVTSSFTTMGYAVIGSFVLEMTYDEFITEYAGIKTYVNDSGKYNRVKYVFTAEVVAEMFDNYNLGDNFMTSANLEDCSLIIVTDKENGSFQGAKLSFKFSNSTTVNDNSTSINANFVASIENCSEVKSFPSDLKDYKDVSEVSLRDISALTDVIFNFFG